MFLSIYLAGESVAVECYVPHFSCARKVGGIKLSPEKTLLFNQIKHRKVKALFCGESVAVEYSHTSFSCTRKIRKGG